MKARVYYYSLILYKGFHGHLFCHLYINKFSSGLGCIATLTAIAPHIMYSTAYHILCISSHSLPVEQTTGRPSTASVSCHINIRVDGHLYPLTLLTSSSSFLPPSMD